MHFLQAYSNRLGSQSNQDVQIQRNTVYFNRWADIQFDGSLEAVDQDIQALIHIVNVILENTDPDLIQDELCNLEWTAYSTTQNLRIITALHPYRCSNLTFDPGSALCTIVSSFFSPLPEEVGETISSGIELAQKCAINVLDLRELSRDEVGYQKWVTPRLLQHLRMLCSTL